MATHIEFYGVVIRLEEKEEGEIIVLKNWL